MDDMARLEELLSRCLYGISSDENACDELRDLSDEVCRHFRAFLGEVSSPEQRTAVLGLLCVLRIDETKVVQIVIDGEQEEFITHILAELYTSKIRREADWNKRVTWLAHILKHESYIEHSISGIVRELESDDFQRCLMALDALRELCMVLGEAAESIPKLVEEVVPGLVRLLSNRRLKDSVWEIMLILSPDDASPKGIKLSADALSCIQHHFEAIMRCDESVLVDVMITLEWQLGLLIIDSTSPRPEPLLDVTQRLCRKVLDHYHGDLFDEAINVLVQMGRFDKRAEDILRPKIYPARDIPEETLKIIEAVEFGISETTIEELDRHIDSEVFGEAAEQTKFRIRENIERLQPDDELEDSEEESSDSTISEQVGAVDSKNMSGPQMDLASPEAFRSLVSAISPFMVDPDEREAILNQAFWGLGITEQVKINIRSENAFASSLVRFLLNYGPIKNTAMHPLDRLVSVLWCGPERQKQIEDLAQRLIAIS